MRDARQLALGLILAGLALAACGAPPAAPSASGGGEQPANSPTFTPTAAPAGDGEPVVETEPTPTPDPFGGDGPWTVTFETEDGETLNGTLFGRGAVNLVLAPDYPGKQDGWVPFAEAASQAGYRALTFDFRGYANPEDQVEWSDSPADLDAALTFLRTHGGQQFIVMGAGQGSLAAILAAGEQPDVIGLVALSTPREVIGLELTDSELRQVEVPSLWIGARTDLSQSVEEFADLVGGDTEVWIYEGSSLHGTFVFQGADQDDLIQRLLDFADRVSGGTGE